MWWGINFWQIIIGVIMFPVLSFSGAVYFQGLQDRSFEPGAIQPRTIQQRQIQQQQLSPATDISNTTWQGTAHYHFNMTDASYCTYLFNIDATFNPVEGNNISGLYTVQDYEERPSGQFNCDTQPDVNANFTGTLVGSRITIDAGQEGTFTGSVTSGTMTLNQPADASGNGFTEPVKLLLNGRGY